MPNHWCPCLGAHHPDQIIHWFIQFQAILLFSGMIWWYDRKETANRTPCGKSDEYLMMLLMRWINSVRSWSWRTCSWCRRPCRPPPCLRQHWCRPHRWCPCRNSSSRTRTLSRLACPCSWCWLGLWTWCRDISWWQCPSSSRWSWGKSVYIISSIPVGSTVPLVAGNCRVGFPSGEGFRVGVDVEGAEVLLS